MNNLQLDKTGKNTKLLTVVFIVMLVMSCAETSVIVMNDSIEQLQNLADYDRDGVIEARDKCAETILGATIDNYGCGKQSPTIEPLNIDIKFSNNSSIIPSSAYAKIKELAFFLDKHQELQVVIEGHTSKVGDGDLNQKLSENRAKSVVLVLVNDFNISEQRVSFVGYGYERLEEEGDTPDAHAINRRIMAELTHTQHIDDMMWTIYTVGQKL